MKKYFVILFLLMQMAQTAVWGAATGTTDDAAVIGGGARALGMGRAYTAVADEADAPLINPAGIAGIRSPQIMTMNTTILGEVYYTEVTAASPTKFGTVAVGYVTTGTNGVLVPVDSQFVYADYYDSLYLLSYSSPLSRFIEYGRNVFLGGSAKLYSRGWTGGYSQSATGFSLDLAMKLIINPYFSLGINRQNILPVSLGGVVRWGSGLEESLMSVTKVGLAVKPIHFKDNLLLDFDADIPAQSTRPFTMHIGAEWKALSFFTLRCGADQVVDAASASGTSWSPAFGVSLGTTSSSVFRIDYAYHPYYNDTALATSYISLYYQADPLYALKGETR